MTSIIIRTVPLLAHMADICDPLARSLSVPYPAYAAYAGKLEQNAAQETTSITAAVTLYAAADRS